MSFVKCYDVVSMVIEEANKRFEPVWKPVEEELNTLSKYCDIIDDLANEFDGESYEVEVDEITLEISIALECGELIIESEDERFKSLFMATSKFGFSSVDEDKLLITFVFPGVWSRD